MSRVLVFLPLSLLLTAGPALASQATYGLQEVLFDANAFNKMLLICIALLGVASVVVTALKLVRPERLDGGSALVSAARWAAPMLGFIGAAHLLLNLMTATAQIGEAIPLAVAAPSLAEALLLVIWGLVAGVVAVVCHWIVSARIERALLAS
ncbi:MAG: MotA/TolQ/ExbB proton channel family protein [Brevundimonas sp.]